jgi:succinyl-CoA synthetase beta subunit
MQIHEYQAKELFVSRGVHVQYGPIAQTVDQAIEAAQKINKYPLIIKAQVHAGGRGKGGGVKLAKNLEEVKKYASDIIGMTLVTKQTGDEGKFVSKIMVAEAADIEKEIYLSLLLDRTNSCITIIASSEGGMDIEEVAEKMPDKIIKVKVDLMIGLKAYHKKRVFLGINEPDLDEKEFNDFLTQTYKLFVDNDMTMVEINPLVIQSDKKLIGVDAKVDIDNNALIRQPELKAMRDPLEEHELENLAFEHGINYINVDDNGTIGSMVNGAGLAMATMDSIKLAGGEPANFLDVGGGASAQMIEEGLKIIVKNKNVKAIFINIFGGILRCDILAEGLINATTNSHIDVPLVVRLKGTNAELGKKMLDDSGLNIISVDGMKEGAEKVVSISKS